MVTAADIARAARTAAAVEDPELPPLTIGELGMLRGVAADEAGRIVARVTPTYSGCPASLVIALAVEVALRDAGFADVRVETELAPAWSAADIGPAGRARLREMGIAPPPAHADDPICCPRCGSRQTTEISAFGSTACKALWRCEACREPFEAFKPL